MAGKSIDKKRHVFWDTDDFPLPDGRNLSWFREKLINAFEKNGFGSTDDLRIRAYGGKKPEGLVRLDDDNFTYVEIGDKYWRTTKMLPDMFRLAYPAPYPKRDASNFMIIAKDTPDPDSHFFRAIREMTSDHFNTFFVLPQSTLEESGPIPWVRAAWFGTTYFFKECVLMYPVLYNSSSFLPLQPV